MHLGPGRFNWVEMDQEIAKAVRNGKVFSLGFKAGVLPSGNTLSQWGERFHERRRAMFPTIPDPFPTTHRHTFIRTNPSGGLQSFYFVNGSTCSLDYGSVTILPDLSLTAITPEADNSVRLTLLAARAGTLQIEASGNLAAWNILKTSPVGGGKVEYVDTRPLGTQQFYRAILTSP